MKFYISSTSGYYDEKTPCDGAVLLNPKRGEFETPEYGIEINTLEELIALKNKVGHPIIIEDSWRNNGYSPYELEIYNDYRE